jgi:hypothetical protein
MAVELRLLATLSQWGYVADFGDVSDSAQFRNFAWARFLFEPGLTYDVAHRLALAAGVGLGASWPVNRPDALSGARFTFIGSPSLDVRVKLRHHVALMLQARGVFGEKAFGIQSQGDGTDEAPDTETERETAYSFIFLIGPMLSF